MTHKETLGRKLSRTSCGVRRGIMAQPVRVRIVVPRVDEDEVSTGLVGLTQMLHETGKADGSAGGLLGGEYGYGANFENDVFMIHRYCWCEREECPWCAGDAGPLSNHSHYFSEGNTTAPNFLHKPSRSKVWWYKYIGRGMEIELKEKWARIMADCVKSLRGQDAEVGK
jgi:hypothetical protein